MFSESVARKKGNQEDRDGKKALVPYGCHLCNRNLWSVKKSTGTSPFLETTYCTSKLKPQHIKKIGKLITKDKSHQGTNLHDVQDLQGDEACCFISDDAIESTTMSSEESSVSGDHHHKGRCRHLFECKETSQILQEHALRPNQGDLMTDVFNCPLWKTAYAPNGLFSSSLLQLNTDGVNPFSANKICYPMWPIMLSVLNWLKYCRNRFENLMLVGVISANGKEEPRSVDPYLEIVVDELMVLSGTSFYDGYKEEYFTFQVHLHNYVLDYPGLNKVFRCTGAGALQGCLWCEIVGELS